MSEQANGGGSPSASGAAAGATPILLAIAGDSGTGKTTITKGLAEALGRDRITSVGTDDHHRYDREERKSLPFTPLHPKCNYIDIMEQHLQHVASGEPILKPIYNHDIAVYLDPPEEIRIAWKLRRDTKKRGYTEDEVREDLKKREPESEEFIRPRRAHADIVIRSAPSRNGARPPTIR